jgi:hypothetical protein
MIYSVSANHPSDGQQLKHQEILNVESDLEK